MYVPLFILNAFLTCPLLPLCLKLNVTISPSNTPLWCVCVWGGDEMEEPGGKQRMVTRTCEGGEKKRREGRQACTRGGLEQTLPFGVLTTCSVRLW